MTPPPNSDWASPLVQRNERSLTLAAAPMLEQAERRPSPSCSCRADRALGAERELERPRFDRPSEDARLEAHVSHDARSMRRLGCHPVTGTVTARLDGRGNRTGVRGVLAESACRWAQCTTGACDKFEGAAMKSGRVDVSQHRDVEVFDDLHRREPVPLNHRHGSGTHRPPERPRPAADLLRNSLTRKW